MHRQKKYNVAVVGVTGVVGKTILHLLENVSFEIGTLKLLASKRSKGKTLSFHGEEKMIDEAVPESFQDIDIALFSAGGSVSKRLAQEAIQRGAVVIDNTSAFRMDPSVPLVIPEVNDQSMADHGGLVANPNCSTIQLASVLKPIQNAYGLERVIVSTYQAASGAGFGAVEDLLQETMDLTERQDTPSALASVIEQETPAPAAYNAVPHIDDLTASGYTKEEIKMMEETKKLLASPDLSIAATCVRIPVLLSHAESVYIRTEQKRVGVSDIRNILANAPGIIVQDDLEHAWYPTPRSASEQDEIFVGRIRNDPMETNGFHIWIVADNLRKGAALNTVQIAESMIKQQWFANNS